MASLYLPGFCPDAATPTEPPQPPAATAENVAAGGSLSPKTFGAFTDPDGVIASYSATATNTSGSTAWSGTGLGAYTPSGAADGSSGVLRLDALDADGDIVATAVHAYSIDAAAGGDTYTALLDWSSASHTFASGSSTPTIGGLSVTARVDAGASLSLASGVLTFTGDSTDDAYLVIDLGKDFAFDAEWWAYLTFESLAQPNAGHTGVRWQLATTTPEGNANDRYQVSLAFLDDLTSLREREANSASNFTTINHRTVVDMSTTPTRTAARMTSNEITPSYDQGSSALPTDGSHLGTVGPNRLGVQQGAVSNPQNRRYLHIQFKTDTTVRLRVVERD